MWRTLFCRRSPYGCSKMCAFGAIPTTPSVAIPQQPAINDMDAVNGRTGSISGRNRGIGIIIFIFQSVEIGDQEITRLLLVERWQIQDKQSACTRIHVCVLFRHLYLREACALPLLRGLDNADF